MKEPEFLNTGFLFEKAGKRSGAFPTPVAQRAPDVGGYEFRYISIR